MRSGANYILGTAFHRTGRKPGNLGRLNLVNRIRISSGRNITLRYGNFPRKSDAYILHSKNSKRGGAAFC
ncbi:hypothetical protein M413DRAFT_442182, partial [Hebeloma cylindrosporum]